MSSTRERLLTYLERSQERFGLYLLDSKGREVFSYNPDVVFPAASSVKVHLVAALLKKVEEGKLSLYQVHKLRDSEKVGGAGILKDLMEGTKFTLYDLAKLAIVISDNTASNILIDYVGFDYIREFLDNLGFKETKLVRKFHIDPTAPPVNFTTPREAALFLYKLWNLQVLSKPYRDILIDIMLNQQYNEKLPLLLPKNVKLAHKTGDISTAANDIGIGFILDENWKPSPYILTKSLQYMPVKNLFFIALYCDNITRKRFLVDFKFGKIACLSLELISELSQVEKV